MIGEIKDKSVLSLISPFNVEHYLSAKNWHVLKGLEGIVVIWEVIDNKKNKHRVWLPLNPGFADYAENIFKALKTIAIVENRTEAQIIEELVKQELKPKPKQKVKKIREDEASPQHVETFGEKQPAKSSLRKRIHEVMYIARPETSDEEITKLNDEIQKLVETEGGTVVRIDNIGRKKLAYEIKHKKEGYYVLLEIEGSGREIAEIERRFRVNDIIIRYITVRVDEDRKAARQIQRRREIRQRRSTGSKIKEADNYLKK